MPLALVLNLWNRKIDDQVVLIIICEVFVNETISSRRIDPVIISSLLSQPLSSFFNNLDTVT